MKESKKETAELSNWSPPIAGTMPPPAPATLEITSRPGASRGYRGIGKKHEGVDIRAAEGTDVQAIGDGKVYYVFDKWKPGDGQAAGNFIIIQHPNGIRSEYMHLSEISVKRGDPVSGGTIIGKTGRTGGARANDPDADPMVSHLHLGIATNEDGSYERVNPTKFVNMGARQSEGLLGRMKAWFLGDDATPDDDARKALERGRLLGQKLRQGTSTLDDAAREAVEAGRAVGKKLQQRPVQPRVNQAHTDVRERQHREWERQRGEWEQQRRERESQQQERWQHQRDEWQRQQRERLQHQREEQQHRQEQQRKDQERQRQEQQRRLAQAREAAEREARLRDQRRREELERQNRQVRFRPHVVSNGGMTGGRPNIFGNSGPSKPMQWRFRDIPGRDTVTLRPGVTTISFGGGTAIEHY